MKRKQIVRECHCGSGYMPGSMHPFSGEWCCSKCYPNCVGTARSRGERDRANDLARIKAAIRDASQGYAAAGPQACIVAFYENGSYVIADDQHREEYATADRAIAGLREWVAEMQP